MATETAVAASFKAYLLADRDACAEREKLDPNAPRTSTHAHLVRLLKELRRERPENPVAALQAINKRLFDEYNANRDQNQKFDKIGGERYFMDDFQIKEMCEKLKKTIGFFKSPPNLEIGTEGSDAANGDHLACPIPDIVDEMFNYRRVGVGISEPEIMKLWISMRNLVEKYESKIRKIRFWGKIFGIKNDYYIIETDMELGEEEGEFFDEAAEESQSSKENGENEVAENADAKSEELLPKPLFKKPPVVPSEQRYGPNKFIYFYCNESTLSEWKKMPQISPSEINITRSLKKYFTGDPNAITTSGGAVLSELSLLRAQVARIASATQVSPVGFFISNDDESDAESDANDSANAASANAVDKLACHENLDFEELPLGELAEPGLTNWCHHAPYILPQGRCIWWNPALARADNENGEAQESESEGDEAGDSENGGGDEDDALFGSKNMRAEPEVGPPLLSALSEDLPLNGCPAWTIALRSADPSQRQRVGMVHLKSQLWPGAHALAKPGGKWHSNVYVGWGVKSEGGAHFVPVRIAQPMLEFPAGKEVREIDDPTVEEEALQKAKEDENNKDEDNEGDEEGSEENESD